MEATATYKMVRIPWVTSMPVDGRTFLASAQMSFVVLLYVCLTCRVKFILGCITVSKNMNVANISRH